MAGGITARQLSEEAEDDRFCIGCGYNLRGLNSEQCPECGLPIDTAQGSEIAWEARNEIGVLRAFWRTMMRGTFRVKRLAHAVAHPVDLGSAMGFRLLVSLLAALPVSVLFWMFVHAEKGTGFLSAWQPGGLSWPFVQAPFPGWWEIPILWSAGATMWTVLPVGAFITVFMGTGVLGYWVRAEVISQERRKRAVAVSAYVSAPLAMLIVPTVGIGLARGMSDLSDHFSQTICTGSLVLGCVSCGLILAAYECNAIRMMTALARDAGVRKACAIVGLPLCWALAAAVGLVGFPMLVGLVWLMVDSLRA
jgi:hypothetical protein